MRRWTGRPIALAQPDVTADDAAVVRATLDSPMLSGGPMIEAFEREWSRRFGAAHAVAVSSGTAALHLAVLTAGVEAHDLVITTPFSFIASANVILYERAVPIFVDIDPDTLAMDATQAAAAAAAIAQGGTARQAWLPPALRREGSSGSLKALLPVHVFGRPASLDALIDIGRAHDVPVIEDACEAIGAHWRGRPVGTIGRAAAFGFYPNKSLTTGEGGMFVTSDEKWAWMGRSLRNQGRDEHAAWLVHNRLGYNYRLDEMSAALGLAQLRRVDELLAGRARVAAMYAERLRACPWLRLPADDPDRTWFVYTVRLQAGVDRDAVMTRLDALGVPSRAYFLPIHLQPYYRDRFGFREGMFPEAERAGREMIALPFHAHLTEAEIDFICAALAHAALAA